MRDAFEQQRFDSNLIEQAGEFAGVFEDFAVPGTIPFVNEIEIFEQVARQQIKQALLAQLPVESESHPMLTGDFDYTLPRDTARGYFFGELFPMRIRMVLRYQTASQE
jgi:hypothetical protein